ncbi:MAG: serine hydrolase [Acidobacteria bacterium]|nr:serine hydrolase [Acidobacteriota bacterium]
MRFVRLLPASLALLSAFHLLAADKAPGVDAERIKRIPARMQAFVNEGKVAGVVTLIMRHGQVVEHDAVGYQDIETKKPMAKDSIFQIMSMTKPVVGVAIMMLAEEGLLSVTDPVEKHLPEYKGQKGGTRPITIRDLMTHTSGMPTQPPKPIEALYAKMDLTLAEAVKIYGTVPLDFEPGTKWQYSNMGIDTLGRIIEVKSGMAFEKFLEARILGPLGMKDSFIFPPAEKTSRIAFVHEVAGPGKLQRAKSLFYGGVSSAYRPNAKFSAPSYGLYSTAADLSHFYQMMLNGGTYGGKRYLSPAAVATMTQLQTGEIKAGNAQGNGFGLTWEVTKEALGTLNLLSIGTYGHGGAFGTHGWVDAKKGLVGVFMIQASGPGDAAFVKSAFMTMAGAAVID